MPIKEGVSSSPEEVSEADKRLLKLPPQSTPPLYSIVYAPEGADQSDAFKEARGQQQAESGSDSEREEAAAAVAVFTPKSQLQKDVERGTPLCFPDRDHIIVPCPGLDPDPRVFMLDPDGRVIFETVEEAKFYTPYITELMATIQEQATGQAIGSDLNIRKKLNNVCQGYHAALMQCMISGFRSGPPVDSNNATEAVVCYPDGTIRILTSTIAYFHSNPDNPDQNIHRDQKDQIVYSEEMDLFSQYSDTVRDLNRRTAPLGDTDVLALPAGAPADPRPQNIRPLFRYAGYVELTPRGAPDKWYVKIDSYTEKLKFSDPKLEAYWTEKYTDLRIPMGYIEKMKTASSSSRAAYAIQTALIEQARNHTRINFKEAIAAVKYGLGDDKKKLKAFQNSLEQGLEGITEGIPPLSQKKSGFFANFGRSPQKDMSAMDPALLEMLSGEKDSQKSWETIKKDILGIKAAKLEPGTVSSVSREENLQSIALIKINGAGTATLKSIEEAIISKAIVNLEIAKSESSALYPSSDFVLDLIYEANQAPIKGFIDSTPKGINFSIQTQLTEEQLDFSIDKMCHLAVEAQYNSGDPQASFDISDTSERIKQQVETALRSCMAKGYPADAQPQIIDQSSSALSRTRYPK